MRRKELTSGQMDDVIRLRERSLSWLSIEKETGIPRRVAQRAYLQLLQRRTSEKLSAVRQILAKEDLQEHRKILLDMAGQLVSLTTIPESSEPSSFLFEAGAEDHLAAMWHRDRWADSLFDGTILIPQGGPSEQQKRQIERRNYLLFKSLKAHTKGRTRWRALEEWKLAWDGCLGDLEILQNEIRLGLEKIFLSDEDLGKCLGEAVLKKTTDKTSRELFRLMKRTLLAAWPRFVLVVSSSKGEGVTAKGQATQYSVKDWQIPLENTRSLKRVCGAVNKIIEEQYSGDTVRRIQSNLKRVRKAALQIEESLDAMVLSPLILATRCDLCPV